MKVKGRTIQEQIDYLYRRIKFSMHEMAIPKILVPAKERCECCLEYFKPKELRWADEHAKVCIECAEAENDYETSR